MMPKLTRIPTSNGVTIGVRGDMGAVGGLGGGYGPGGPGGTRRITVAILSFISRITLNISACVSYMCLHKV